MCSDPSIHEPRYSAKRWARDRRALGAPVLVLLLVMSAGCGSKSHASPSTSESTSISAASSTKVSSTSPMESPTASVAGDSSSSTTKVSAGSIQSAPTLPPQLMSPPEIGSSPKLTAGQWSKAAKAYDALPALDPCDVQHIDDAFHATDTPGDSPSESEARAFVNALVAEMRLYARSVTEIDSRDAATVLQALDVAESKLDGPFPTFFKAFFDTFAANRGGDALTSIYGKVKEHCDS